MKSLLLLLLFTLSITAESLSLDSREGDSLAVVDFYNSFIHNTGESLSDRTSWDLFTLESCPYVTVENGRVVALNFSLNRSTGPDYRLDSIPRSIGNLSQLKSLIISRIDSEEYLEIPSEIGNLTALVELEMDGVNIPQGDGGYSYSHLKLKELPTAFSKLLNLISVDFSITTLNYSDYYRCMKLPAIENVHFTNVKSQNLQSYVSYNSDSTGLYVKESLENITFEWFDNSGKLIHTGEALHSANILYSDEFSVVPVGEDFNCVNAKEQKWFLKSTKAWTHGDSLSEFLQLKLLDDSTGFFIVNGDIIYANDSVDWYLQRYNWSLPGKGDVGGGTSYLSEPEPIANMKKDTLFFADFVDVDKNYAEDEGYYNGSFYFIGCSVKSIVGDSLWCGPSVYRRCQVDEWIKNYVDPTEITLRNAVKQHRLVVKGASIEITAGTAYRGKISIFDLKGRELYSVSSDIKAGVNNVIIPKSFAVGTYIVQLRSPVGVINQKVLIQ